jgi:OOP family OmpA-OmpF porin
LNKLVIAATFAIASSAAAAGEAPYFYAGADVGTTKGDGSSDRESGFGVFGGYQINPSFAIEAAYRSLADYNSTFDGEPYDYRLTQTSLSAVGTIPLNEQFKLFGRIGYNRLVGKTSYDFGHKLHASRAMFGAGIAYDFTPAVSVRVELQKPMSELTTLSAGVSFRF